MTQAFTATRADKPHALFAVIGLALIALLWAYWTALAEAAQRWAHDPQYSHGYLVPGFALVLLWLRRDRLAGAELRTCWWGLAMLLGAVAMRLVGTYFHFVWLDPISLLPSLGGLCLLAGGWRCLAWSWPAITFLFFMIPLPWGVENGLAAPLRSFATQASTFVLQAIGRPAVAEGNVILINEIELGVEEACSGLRMLIVFFALSTAVAILMHKPLWERLLVAMSAVPIALLVNVLRISATGVLHETAGKEFADAVFHDLAGWLMMPLALGFLALELKILKHLLLDPKADESARRVTAPVPSLPTIPATLNVPATTSTSTASALPSVRRNRRQRSDREVAKPFGRG